MPESKQPRQGGVMVFEWFRSNVEVFLIAFVLAMTIRSFCLDGYKIPTESMEPTLMGDIRDGDRIIADKFSIFFKPIQRFDVIIFKFPLDRTKNFVKRVVGLPQETLTIKYGDIYTKKENEDEFHLARKPLDIQQSIWLPVWRWCPDLAAIKEVWELPETNLVRIVNNQLIFEPKAEQDILFRWRGAIMDRYNERGGGNAVPDIKIAFSCRFTKPSGIIKLSLKNYLGRFTWTLSPVSENYLEYNGVKIARLKKSPHPLKDHLVEFMFYDGQLYLKLDREIVASYTYDSYSLDFSGSYKEPIEISAGQSEVSFWDVNIWRDIFYIMDGYPDKTVSIPADKYFVIGDNVPRSRDSRLWVMKTVYLNDGRIIQYDGDPQYSREWGDYLEIIRTAEGKGGDIWGNSHKIHTSRIKNREDDNYKKGDNYPFVDKVDIFGKGLFIYWPLGRMKIIR